MTVLIDTSAMRLVALRLLPSTSAEMISTRLAVFSLFMGIIICVTGQACPQNNAPARTSLWGLMGL